MSGTSIIAKFSMSLSQTCVHLHKPRVLSSLRSIRVCAYLNEMDLVPYWLAKMMYVTDLSRISLLSRKGVHSILVRCSVPETYFRRKMGLVMVQYR